MNERTANSIQWAVGLIGFGLLVAGNMDLLGSWSQWAVVVGSAAAGSQAIPRAKDVGKGGGGGPGGIPHVRSPNRAVGSISTGAIPCLLILLSGCAHGSGSRIDKTRMGLDVSSAVVQVVYELATEQAQNDLDSGECDAQCVKRHRLAQSSLDSATAAIGMADHIVTATESKRGGNVPGMAGCIAKAVDSAITAADALDLLNHPAVDRVVQVYRARAVPIADATCPVPEGV